jgi:hypothetical protein
LDSLHLLLLLLLLLWLEADKEPRQQLQSGRDRG